MSKPEIGSFWYVQIGNSVKVQRVKVKDVTDKTIALEYIDDIVASLIGGGSNERYVRDKVTLLEEFYHDE